MTAIEQLARDAFAEGARVGLRVAVSSERGVQVRMAQAFEDWYAHRTRFRRGARVKYRVRPRGRTSRAGVIKNNPGPTAKTAYVAWPDGWAGHEWLDQLEVVY